MEEKDLQASTSSPLGVDVTDVPLNGNGQNGAKFVEEPIPVFNMRAPEEPVIAELAAEAPAVAPPPAGEKRSIPVSGFMRPGGIFEGYEINNHKEMPFFMRVFAASALLHLVVFAASLQLPTYVERACDSNEFTQRVCDTIYLASLIDTSREWENRPVDDPTQIPEAEINGADVTFLDVSSESDLKYPEGYWALRDEIEGRLPIDQLAGLDPTLGTVPGFPSYDGTNSNIVTPSVPGIDLSKPQRLPKQNNRAVVGGGANPLFSVEGEDDNAPDPAATTPSNSRGNQGGPLSNGGTKVAGTNSNSGQNQTTPGVTPQTNTSAGEKYNKAPLYGFRDWLVEWRNDPRNNFGNKFEYSITGTIDKDGKLVTTGTPVFKGDQPQMEEFVRKGVAAFSDSGMLKLLDDLKSKSVKIVFVQDGEKFNIKLESAQASDQTARKLFSGLSGALVIGKMFVEAGIVAEPDPKNKQKEQATLDLLKMAEVKKDKNTVIIDTTVPNSFAENMFLTYKQALAEELAKGKPGVE